MNPAKDIAVYLAASPRSTNTATSGRVFWPYPTQDVALPYVCVRLAQTRRMAVSLEGAQAPRDFVVEVHCFAASQSAAWTVADAVTTDLDNTTGVTIGASTFKQCYCSDAADLIREDDFAAGVFGVALTFTVKI
jgi:hypothetical protein